MTKGKSLVCLIAIMILSSCGGTSTSSFIPSAINSSPSQPETSSPASTSSSTKDSVPSTSLNKVKDREYGLKEEIEYISCVTNSAKHATVALPHDYDESKSYPVIYLLHGIMSDHNSWFNQCNAQYIIENLAYDGLAEEMIIVGVNEICTIGEEEPSILSDTLTTAYDSSREDILNSLMPYVESHYSVMKGKENTAVAGYSMGGRESLYISFTNQNVFGYIGAFSSADFGKSVMDMNPKDSIISEFTYDDPSDPFSYVLLTIGDNDFMTSTVTPKIHENMEKNNVAHDYETYSGGHDYNVWKQSLYKFVQNIFH